MDWLTGTKIPVGSGANVVFVWMKTHLTAVFDAISWALEGLIAGFLWLLQAPNPLVLIAVFVALAWVLQRNWKICVGVALGFLFVVNQGYWKETTESLTLILSSCAVCMAIGVPVGIACAHNARLNAAISPVLDLMQTLPTFVYLIPAIIFFGIGMVPGLIATVIFVLPAPIRLTELGVASTPTALLEAATAFGATPAPAPVEGRTALGPAANYGGVEPNHHAVAVDGGDRLDGGCQWLGRAGDARARFSQRC